MRFLTVACSIFMPIWCSANSATSATSSRLALLGCSYSPNGNLYYFGVGSNMLKSKVTNRGVNGTKIEIQNITPGYAPKHRLAFNMRGFPPLEPAMGGIEPCDESICHGALIELSPDDYQKLWVSEGGSQPRPGYDEVIVEIFPYGSTVPVKAIALRAGQHVRLNRDLCPSKRYMSILLDGALELGLEPAYIEKLRSIPTANPSLLLKFLSLHSLLFYGLLLRLKLRSISLALTSLKSFLYVPPTSSSFKIILSELALCVLMLPCAMIGALIMLSYRMKGEELPPMVRAMWSLK
eukprot:gene6102-12355_t